MKTFLRLILQYGVILLAIIILLDNYTNSVIRNKADFKLNGRPKFLILGHSHPECAFDDSLIDNTINLSTSGEAYFYTFFKIRNILNQNPTVNCVFLEFTNNQIIDQMDEWTWGDNSIHKSSLYAPFMSFSDKNVLRINNPLNYFNVLSISNQKKIDRIYRERYSYKNKLGGYRYLDRHKTDSLLKEKDKDISLYTKNVISTTNMDYLDKMINFFREKKIKLFFIRSPLHKKYVGYLNEKKYQSLRELKYSDIEYLDFSKFPLNNNEFGDLEHLNYKGAKKFSIWFNIMLAKGLLNKNDKQRIINTELNILSLRN